MNDRELLEAAAKAAGVVLLRAPDGSMRNCTGLQPEHNILAAPLWYPLADDGDALRLAMALDMRIHPMPGFGDDCVICSTDQPRIVGWAQEKFGNDKAAATRRAIVRAAALGGATGAGGE